MVDVGTLVGFCIWEVIGFSVRSSVCARDEFGSMEGKKVGYVVDKGTGSFESSA